jgi:hypothetical protein
VSPDSSQCGSATTITIAGANLMSASLVQLQTTGLTASLPTFTVNSDTRITATLPSTLPGGVYEVVVFTPTGTSTQSLQAPRTDLFSVAPTVTGLAPNSGPVAGTTAVTVNGSCLERGSRFFFGTNEASVGNCPSTTQCTVYSPAATYTAAFPVDVVAEAGGARSATGPADLFTYTGPQIASLSPSSGPITGGTQVMISGSGFPQVNQQVLSLSGPVMTLTFGGTRGLADCYPTWCMVSTPSASTPGPVDVEMDAFGTIDLVPQGFTYTAAPKLSRFDAAADYSAYLEVAGLDGNAAAGGASIAVTSSNPSLVIPTSPINIPPLGQVAAAPVTVNPSPTYQTVTLTATYNGTSLTSTVAVPPSPALAISVDATAMNKGDSATVTLSINSPAPVPGGAVVNLSSSSPSAIAVPTSVTIPEGQYSTTFPITDQYAGGSSTVKISGTYNGASASDSIIVFTPPPVCQVHQCAHLYYWDSAQCKCVKGIPQH